MNNEILTKVDEIINYIENTNDYKKYLLLKDRISTNLEIQSLLNEIRHLQKLLANKNDMNIKKELEIKNELLRNIPLYREYLNILDDINNIFNIIETQINNYFNNKVN